MNITSRGAWCFALLLAAVAGCRARTARNEAAQQTITTRQEASAPQIRTGAERTELYMPLLEGRKVGILTNQSGVLRTQQGDWRHIVDSLHSAGVQVESVFAPEHGFRGTAGAGERVADSKDPATGIRVISIYGASRRPRAEDVGSCDIILFDLQDVGLRFYTYLSSLHLMMETCAETGTPLVVLDRPNPNGMYVDGPILDTARYRSFVGMHPIPVVHGMTLGELARMINGEGWLRGGRRCDLTVIPCEGYSHAMRYELPVRPSPNLPNMRAVYLYPSLCVLESTPVSVGRGTEFPFQVYGHPDMRGDFSFTPRSMEGAPNPPQKGRLCHGRDLRGGPSDEEIIARGINLEYLADCWRQTGGDKFFSNSLERLMGVDYIRTMLKEGAESSEIEACWRGDVKRFLPLRARYLLYED